MLAGCDSRAIAAASRLASDNRFARSAEDARSVSRAAARRRLSDLTSVTTDADVSLVRARRLGSAGLARGTSTSISHLPVRDPVRTRIAKACARANLSYL